MSGFTGQKNQGNSSISIGRLSGFDSQGADSIAIGRSSGEETQGIECTSVGLQAGSSNQGQYSVALGAHAGETSQGENSVAVGYYAGQIMLQPRSNIVAVGYYAGNNNPGNSSICIGSESGKTNCGDYSINIGSDITNEQNNTIVLNASGNPFTTASNANAFYVSNIRAENSGSIVNLSYDTVTKEIVHPPSSEKFKYDIKDLELDSSEKIYELRPRTFKYKSNNQSDVGLIAEEVYKIAPELVKINKDKKPIAINWESLLVYILNELKKNK